MEPTAGFKHERNLCEVSRAVFMSHQGVRHRRERQGNMDERLRVSTRRTVASGMETDTSRSSRPGRRRAGSMAFGRFVAPTTTTGRSADACPGIMEPTNRPQPETVSRTTLPMPLQSVGSHMQQRARTAWANNHPHSGRAAGLGFCCAAPADVPSSRVSSCATTRDSCGRRLSRRGHRASSSSRNITAGAGGLRASPSAAALPARGGAAAACSKASRRRLSDSPV